MDFYARLTAFLIGYANVPDYYYDKNGNLDSYGCKQIISYLLAENVFENAEELRKEALKEYSIIIPDEFFIMKGAGQ